MSIDNRRDRVAKALADFDQTPFGEMTLTKPDGTDPRIIDTRTAYRREAERFMAMLNAATEPSTTDAIMALLPSLPDGWVAFVQGVADARNGEGMFWTTPDRDQDQDVIDRMGDAAELLIRAMLSARPTPPTARDTVTLADGSVVEAPAATPPTYVGMHSPTHPTPEGIASTDTPPTEPPREWDMREATLNQSGCEVLIAFESAARACQFFDDVMEHPVLVPLPAPPKPLETER